MKKILVVISSVLVVFLAACSDEEVTTIEYDIYEPEYVANDEINILTDWNEFFETSFYEFFGADGSEEWTGFQASKIYQHPTLSDVLLWFSFFHEADGYINQLIIPMNMFIDRDVTSIDELRQLFGENLQGPTYVPASEFGPWQVRIELDEDFHAIISLTDEDEAEIQSVMIWRNVNLSEVVADEAGQDSALSLIRIPSVEVAGLVIRFGDYFSEIESYFTIINTSNEGEFVDYAWLEAGAIIEPGDRAFLGLEHAEGFTIAVDVVNNTDEAIPVGHGVIDYIGIGFSVFENTNVILFDGLVTNETTRAELEELFGQVHEGQLVDYNGYAMISERYFISAEGRDGYFHFDFKTIEDRLVAVMISISATPW